MSTISYPLKISAVYETSDFSSENMKNFISENASAGLPSENVQTRWGLFCWHEFSSVVENGEAQGQALHDLIAEHGQAFMGKLWKSNFDFPLYFRMYESSGKEFPQIHSQVATSHAQFEENNKIWFILHGGNRGKIAAGVSSFAANRHRFAAVQEEIHCENIAQIFSAEPGDVCYLPNRRIHHLMGQGIVIWEIGQYPVPAMEMERTDSPEKIEEGQIATKEINFQDYQLVRLCGESGKTTITKKIKTLPYCPYFFVEEIRLFGTIYDRTTPESCVSFIVLEGEVTIESNGVSEIFYAGDVCILPSCCGEYALKGITHYARLLQIIPNLHAAKTN